MQSTIEKIFNKELGYRETAPTDKEYQEANKEYCKAYEALEKTLNKKQSELLSDLFLAEGCVQGVLEHLFFKDGFFAGLRLGIELCEEEK